MKDKPVLPMPNLLEVIKELQEFCKTEIIEWEVDQYCLRDSNTDNYPDYKRLEGRADFATEVLKEIEILKQEKINE
jgi:hypothetical protein